MIDPLRRQQARETLDAPRDREATAPARTEGELPPEAPPIKNPYGPPNRDPEALRAEAGLGALGLSKKLLGLDRTILDAVRFLSERPLTGEELGSLRAKLETLTQGDLQRLLQGTRSIFGPLTARVEARKLSPDLIHGFFSLRSHQLACEARIAALPEAHRAPTTRFHAALDEFVAGGLLGPREAEIVREHVLRLGERSRNAANTGNLLDLFIYTLNETKDPIRAFAQVLADSIKIIPMPQDAVLEPPVRKMADGTTYHRIADLPFDELSKFLVGHTAVAYTDPEMRKAASAMIRAHLGELPPKALERELYKMILESQHLPSSAFVLSKASGYALDVRDVAMRAGYSEEEARAFQSFYDVSSEFRPEWMAVFSGAATPAREYRAWRERYHAARERLPEALRFQLESDTLTNFLEHTMESGKWVDAVVTFGEVKEAAEVPARIAGVVRQYLAEYQELHARPGEVFKAAVGGTLAKFGIIFDEAGIPAAEAAEPPAKQALMNAQFEAAKARKEAQKRA